MEWRSAPFGIGFPGQVDSTNVLVWARVPVLAAICKVGTDSRAEASLCGTHRIYEAREAGDIERLSMKYFGYDVTLR